jgi:hypothetical protein
MKHGSLIFCIQYSYTPAVVASLNGRTETLALLLANKVDVNSADKVQQFSFKIGIFLVSNNQRF